MTTTHLRSSAVVLCAGLLCAACLNACTTDPQLSLGHHDPGLLPVQDAEPVPPPFYSGPLPTAGAAGASSGGAGGMFPVPPPVDSGAPPPAMEGGAMPPILCSPGVYTAQLACEITNSPFGPPRGTGGLPPPPMSTASDLMIEPALGQADRAQVSGRLSFVAWDTQFDARIVGQLDCGARLFHADIVDGTFVPLMATSGTGGEFVGALDAQLDPLTGDLFGVWFHTPQTGGPRCNGTWSATSVSDP